MRRLGSLAHMVRFEMDAVLGLCDVMTGASRLVVVYVLRSWRGSLTICGFGNAAAQADKERHECNYESHVASKECE